MSRKLTDKVESSIIKDDYNRWKRYWYAKMYGMKFERWVLVDKEEQTK